MFFLKLIIYLFIYINDYWCSFLDWLVIYLLGEGQGQDLGHWITHNHLVSADLKIVPHIQDGDGVGIPT
jgi:hypothetical protein